jgi:small redox-active disulfide protein 2
MEIKVLGTGCKKCKTLEENVKKALKAANLEASIEKVEDLKDIIEYGVMNTPALVINGEVKSTGKVLKPAEIQKLF